MLYCFRIIAIAIVALAIQPSASAEAQVQAPTTTSYWQYLPVALRARNDEIWYSTAMWNEAARPKPPPPARKQSPVRSSQGTSGACTGFVIPDYIIQRESGGNPSASNPSGAWGCAQTLLSHYRRGGACAGLDPYTIEGQRECVRIISHNGTDLSPWAATR